VSKAVIGFCQHADGCIGCHKLPECRVKGHQGARGRAVGLDRPLARRRCVVLQAERRRRAAGEACWALGVRQQALAGSSTLRRKTTSAWSASTGAFSGTPGMDGCAKGWQLAEASGLTNLSKSARFCQNSDRCLHRATQVTAQFPSAGAACHKQ
jgi:hypothetical protein